MNYRSVVRFAAVTAMTAAAAFSADFQIEDTKIPFAFRAGKTQMPAGSYRVTREAGRTAPILFLSNHETGKSIGFLMPIEVSPDNSLDGRQARMIFTCAASDCALTEVQPGQGAPFGRRTRRRCGDRGVQVQRAHHAAGKGTDHGASERSSTLPYMPCS